MKNKKLNTIRLNDSNNTIITTHKSKKEFMKILDSRDAGCRGALPEDYLMRIIHA